MNLYSSLNEEINYKRLKQLHQYSHLIPNLKPTDLPKIKSYYKSKNWTISHHNETAKIEKKYKPNVCCKDGRIYADGFSLQNLPKRIRSILCHLDNGNPIYRDIDMENAHPSIIIQLSKKYEFDCSVIKEYVDNREEKLKDVMDYYNCDRDTAKELFIRLLYTGSIESWESDNKCQKEFKIEFVVNFYKCMRKLCDKFFNHFDFQKNRNEALNKKTSQSKYINHQATCLSYITQEIENKILESIVHFFKVKGYQVGAFCYDGAMFYDKGEDMISLLGQCESFIEKKTEFIVKLTEKKFKHYIDWDKTISVIEKGDFDESEVYLGEYFNLETFGLIKDEIPMKHYNMLKYYFEHFFKFSKCQDSWYVKELNNTLTSMKYPQLRLQLGCIETQFIRGKESYYTFMEYYMKDLKRQSFIDLNYYPYNPITNKIEVVDNNYINTFIPYGNNIIPKEQLNMEEQDTILEHIKIHFKRLCESNDELLHWFLSALHHTIVNPELSFHKLMVFLSEEEGFGKSLLNGMMSNLIGKTNVRNFDNGIQSLAGDRFSEKSANVKAVFIDELDQDKKLGSLMTTLMAIITNDNISYEMKGQKVIKVRNIALFFAFGNKDVGIKVNTLSSTNRRLFIVKADEETTPYPVGTSQYNNWVVNNIALPFSSKDYDKVAVSHLFWFLYDYKALEFLKMNNIPKSKGMGDVRDSNASIQERFLKDYFFDNPRFVETGVPFEELKHKDREGIIYVNTKKFKDEWKTYHRDSNITHITFKSLISYSKKHIITDRFTLNKVQQRCTMVNLDALKELLSYIN